MGSREWGRIWSGGLEEGEGGEERRSILEVDEENRVERMCPPVAMLMRVEMARAAGRKVEEVEEEVTSPACPSLVSRELDGRVRCQVAR